MVANYHTHTFRCNHASGTEREYIEKAIERGLDTLGFSDHSPYFFDGDYYSSFRMKREQTEDYVSTLSALRDEYKDKIRILIGYEAEYYPKYFNKLIDFISGYGYDYLILGQHMTGNEDGHASVCPTDSEQILETFVNQTLEGLSTGKFLYCAHPDLLNFVGDSKIYKKHMTRLCVGAKEMDIPLEINMLGLDDGRSYPHDEFFDIAKEVGNKIVFGCDAHCPDFVANERAIKKAEAFAKKHKLKVLERLI